MIKCEMVKNYLLFATTLDKYNFESNSNHFVTGRNLIFSIYYMVESRCHLAVQQFPTKITFPAAKQGLMLA
jgi:hypothetical protein